MSMIEGDCDVDMCDSDEVKDVVVVGNRDRPFDVNEGWGTRLVSRSSNGHQSNVVSGVPDALV